MRPWIVFLSLLVLAASLPANAAEEMVTIPRSRLEELERKAAELDQLKSQLNRPDQGAPQTRPTLQPRQEITREIQPVPRDALKPAEVISAEDLADHYLHSPAAAKARYEDQRIRVKGVIVGFEKPVFSKDYSILLDTAERGSRVVCAFVAPTDWKAIYTVNDGSELVVTHANNSRGSLGRVGDVVVIEGKCKGLKGVNVRLAGAVTKDPR